MTTFEDFLRVQMSNMPRFRLLHHHFGDAIEPKWKQFHALLEYIISKAQICGEPCEISEKSIRFKHLSELYLLSGITSYFQLLDKKKNNLKTLSLNLPMGWPQQSNDTNLWCLNPALESVCQGRVQLKYNKTPYLWK